MNPTKVDVSKQKPSKNSINKAGEIISSKHVDFTSKEYQEAYEIISHWRALHTYPLNTFQANLRKKVVQLGLPKESYLISQRLKRIVSIITKLRRFPGTQLSRMQDIGGIRLIVPNMKEVILIQEIYLNKNTSKLYKLIRHKDYISDPKTDGYRSLHLIFEYTNNLYPQTTGLQFEFQVRTFVQHARATAVETIGTFIGHSLKSNQGPNEWLEYFKYVSVGFSYLEGTRIHQDFSSLSPKEIISKIEEMTVILGVEEKIKGFSVATKIIKEQISQTKKGAKFFVVLLDTEKRALSISSFSTQQKKVAIEHYKSLEQEALQNTKLTVVLVSIDKVNALQKAYPSYFGDNKLFLDYLRELKKYGQ